MDECELGLLVKELESDQTELFKYIDREVEKKTTTYPVEDYEKITKVGQGTFGEVFKVQHKTTKEIFALKRLRTEKETEGVLFELPTMYFFSVSGYCTTRSDYFANAAA